MQASCLDCYNVINSKRRLDQECEKAVARGAVLIMPPATKSWGQRTSYVADPEGNLIEIGLFNKGAHRNMMDEDEFLQATQ